MLDLASALGLEIKIAMLVRSNIAVIVILDCTISFLLGSRSNWDPDPPHYRRSEKARAETEVFTDESFRGCGVAVSRMANVTGRPWRMIPVSVIVYWPIFRGTGGEADALISVTCRGQVKVSAHQGFGNC